MPTITPCLWFDGNAEEAATFYTSLLPDSRIDKVYRAPGNYPSGKAGDVLTVEFTLMGRPFVGLNGGPHFKLSWQIVPRKLPALLGDANPARAKRTFESMMQMKRIDIAALERAADGLV